MNSFTTLSVIRHCDNTLLLYNGNEKEVRALSPHPRHDLTATPNLSPEMKTCYVRCPGCFAWLTVDGDPEYWECHYCHQLIPVEEEKERFLVNASGIHDVAAYRMNCKKSLCVEK